MVKIATSASHWNHNAAWELLTSCDMVITTMIDNESLHRALGTAGIPVLPGMGETDKITSAKQVNEFIEKNKLGHIGIDLADNEVIEIVSYGSLRTAARDAIIAHGIPVGKTVDKLMNDRVWIQAEGLSHFLYEVRYEMPQVTLSNGLTVLNFSSGHAFKFEDGSLLPACDTSRVEGLTMKKMVTPYDEFVKGPERYKPVFRTVTPTYEISANVRSEIERILSVGDGEYRGDFVILVPYPVHDALRRYYGWSDNDFVNIPFRVILQGKRAQDNGHPEIKADEFCW